MYKSLKVISLLIPFIFLFSCKMNIDENKSEGKESTKEDKIIGIKIVKGPKTITYEQGSELNLDGLVVEEVYESGKSKQVKDYSTKPENHSILNTIGINTISVYYEDFETSTFVTVNEKIIPKIIAPSYFWGNWQRMDSGEVYTIDETTVSKNIDSSSYQILSVTENSITSELGVFQKQSEQVLIKDSIPYFRQGGSNLTYSLKIVGFTDQIQNRSASTIGQKKYKGKGRSNRFPSYSSENESDDDGVLYLTAPTVNDIQTVTIETEDSIVVVPGLKIENDGANMGTIPIVGKNDYSLKITGSIDDSEKNEGYLYGNYYKNYPLTLTITNISNIDSSPLLCTIEPENEQLAVTSSFDISGIPISSLKSGLTKTIQLNVQYGSIYQSYVDTGLKVTIKDSKTSREWSDYIPLRFYKGLMPVTIEARSTENNAEAALNGFIIYPDGNTQFFSVSDNTRKVLYVPTFGSSKNYLLAFSGATVSGELSESTEMFYTVSICSSTPKKVVVSGNEAFAAMQFGENNETEDTAYIINNEFEAYIADGDIDFFKFEAESSVILLPNELSICEIFYESEFGSVPDSIRLAAGTILTTDLLPELSMEGWYFAGWYDNETRLNIGDDIKGSIRATAKWHKLCTVSFETEKGVAPSSIVIPANIPFKAENLPVIEKQGSYKHLGWYLSGENEVLSELIVEEDCTLKAKWVLSECVLNYSSEYGTVPIQKDFAYNTILTTEDLPELSYEGYTFLGWFIGDEKVSAGYLLQKNETLFAKWQINSYEITYYTQFGTTPEPIVLQYGESYSKENLATLSEPGYTFLGWFYYENESDEGEKITTDNVVTANTILVAKWQINNYSIIYESDHGTVPESITKEYKSRIEKVNLPFLRDDGYNFLGWFIGDLKVTEEYIIKSDITLTAKWEAFVYHVGDIVLEDGTRVGSDEFDAYVIDPENKPVAVIFSETDSEKNLPAKGIGLYQSSNTMAWASSTSNCYKKMLDEMKAEKTDGYNNWTYLKYTYSSDCTSTLIPALYWANNYGSSYCSANIADNWYLPTLAEFAEIYKNKDSINKALQKASGNLVSDTEFWTSTQCSLENQRSTSFYFKDGSQNDYLKTKSLYVRAVRNFGTMLTVTFDSDGGTSIEKQTVKNNFSLIEPVSPKKQGCKFIGWYLDDDEYDFSTQVTEDITLKAHWEGANIPITVDEYEIGDIVLKDGTVLRNIQETLSNEQLDNAIAVIFRVNTRNQKALGIGLKTTSTSWCSSNAKGYKETYNSWNAICSNDPEGAANAQTYYPAFYWINNYSIVAGFTGELAEGWYMPTRSEMDLVASNITAINRSFSNLNLPSVTNAWTSDNYNYTSYWTSYYCAYVFDGSSTSNYFSKTTAENVYAIREFGSNSATYTVTFMSDNSTTDMIIDSGRTCTEPNITNDGYKLEGWYVNDKKFDFSTPITEDITLTAKWELKYLPIEVDTYNFGDVLLKDGKVFRGITSSLSATQKEDVIAVIFREASDGEPALGLGLKQVSTQWCCSNDNGRYSDNWNSWEEILFKDKSRAADPEKNYPAFYWASNYSELIKITDEKFRDWYIPTYSDAELIYKNYTIMSNLMKYVGGNDLSNSFLTSTSYYREKYYAYNSYSYYDYYRTANGGYCDKKTSNATRVIISLDSVSISFDTKDANQFINKQRIVKGNHCTKPADPTLNYCSFKGWYLNGELFDFNSSVNEDIRLEAKWEYSILPEEVSEYKIGDAVSIDGKVFRNVDTSKLPSSQKQEIIAIIVKNADDTNPALGISLKQGSYAWGSSIFGQYPLFDDIKVSYTGTAKAYEFTEDMDPTDNWDYIRSIDDKYSTNYTTTASGYYYPAWYYVNLYGKIYYNNSELYKDGWFIPNTEMLQYLSCNYVDINTMLTNYGGASLSSSFYWSCNQASNSSKILSINLSTGELSEVECVNSRDIRPMRYFGGKTVRFDSDGGTEIVTKVINSGNKVSEPPVPIKENGYVFDGWYLNDSAYDFNTPVTSDIALKAHWKESNNTPFETSEYRIGDIILKDGKVIRNIEGTLSEELKNHAIAIIYKELETDSSALAFGLEIGSEREWAASGTTGYSTNFVDIQGTSTSGDMDGSNNWDYISSINTFGASDAAKNYPVFDYANKYSSSFDPVSEFKNGWYIPSVAELFILNETEIRDVYWKLGKGSIYKKSFWSSTQDANGANRAYCIDNGNCGVVEKNSKKNVLVIRKF